MQWFLDYKNQIWTLGLKSKQKPSTVLWFNALKGAGCVIETLCWPAWVVLPRLHCICSFTEETTFQTPKSSQMPSVPPLVKTSLFSPKLSTPDASNPFGTPFGSSVVNRMAGIFDVNTCYGSPQGPQLIRRGPRLWTHASGESCLFSKM